MTNLRKNIPRRDRVNGVLLWLSLFSLISGIFLPAITIKTFVLFQDTVSIYSALASLLIQGNYLLFAIIFIFSMLFPFGKIFTLLIIWHSADWSGQRVQQIAHWSEQLGKWSMLDVFVIANFVVIVKLGAFADVEVHYGLYIFVVSVVLALYASSRINHLFKKAK